VETWLAGARMSESWKRHATNYLEEFCRFVVKTPDQLLKERRAGKRRDPNYFKEEMLLDRWHASLLKRHTQGTAQLKFCAVVSFFKYNRSKLEIPKFPKVEKSEYRGARRLRKEEIRRMMSLAATDRMKLMLVAGAESGLRGRALSALTLGCLARKEDGTREGVRVENWRELEDPSLTVPVRIQLPAQFYFGAKKEGITFLCRDAVAAVIESLKARETRGEQIGPETPLLQVYEAALKVPGKGVINTWLSEYRRPGEKIARLLPRRAADGKERLLPVDCEVVRIRVLSVAEDSLEADMRTLRDKAALTYDRNQERPASLHSLRKYLRSTLDASGINAVLASTIIGHSNAIEEHYSGRKHLDLEEIRHAYATAMHRVSISEEVDQSTVVRLEEKVQAEETTNKALLLQLRKMDERVRRLELVEKGAS
jgi:hypothetical protein